MTAISDLTLDISQSVEIEASIADAYAALIRRLTTESSTADNKRMPMVLEQWPGGRWFRDLGDGQGHLWGFVQVIKPPSLIEIQGPMFMSYPAVGHVQFRLTENDAHCELSLRHQVLGQVIDDHRHGVVRGWEYFLQGVKSLSQ